MTPDLAGWLIANDFSENTTRSSVDGGCISQAWHIRGQTGDEVFIKTLEDAPTRFYECEAEGLNYLHRVGSLVVPEVRGYGENFIALEYIYPGQQKANFWQSLGRQLAHLHSVERGQFGFANDNYCGTSKQNNQYKDNGFAFFAQNRLKFQADKAIGAHLLSSKDYDQILKLMDKLESLIPFQPASLLHGDLWSGNVYVSSDGEPVFIDPAAYFAWAEIDIAMTQLFGGFPDEFYRAYQEVRPLDYGWQERLALYNLYPLLNHVNLFGGSYIDSVRTILKRFV